MQPQSNVSTVSSNSSSRPGHYNIQFTNSPQPKHASAYDEYNRDMVDSAAAVIDSFDGEPIPKFTTLSSVSKNSHRSPIPNVYTLARTTSKSASAKLRNSMIMSMNSNIPLSSSNNNNNNNNSNRNNSTSSNFSTISENVPMVSQNPNYNNRYSYQQHPQQQPPQQPPQQQILQHNVYQTPQSMSQNQPPNGILMDSQYTMYEAQQKSQELMKKYNENLRMNTNVGGNGQGNGMMYNQIPSSLPPKTYYTSPESTEPIPLTNSMMSGAGSYSTGDLYNSKRMSTHSYTVAANNKMSVYKHPAKSKSSSSLNVVNDWHNKELPPINISHKTGSSGNLRALSNSNPHSANDILYQQQMQGPPPKAMPPMYNNSPISMNGHPQDKRSSRQSMNHSGSQFSVDSPMDAPPRLTKFFGYMPNEVISPIKITDDYQQDLQKMEDMTNNFYLSPLNPNSSPSITHSFSNLHINSNASSASNTPLRSYNSLSSVSTPNGQMEQGTSISPLASKASNISLSVSYY